MYNELGSILRALPRVVLYIIVTLPSCVVQAVAITFNLPLMRSFPRSYHRFCMRILGIKVVITGKRSKIKPTLFVANHSSYLDIPVLGSILVASFVAKTEVATWPFFGMLAKLQRTIFIDRKPSHAATHSDDIKTRLSQHENLILFPEGTSSDGNRTLPFKTALFSVTDLRTTGKDGTEQPLTVQPVSITCIALDGMPMGRFLRPIYAWYGDMPLVPHLWRLLALGQITVAVHFHEPVTVTQLGSRKAVAEHCWCAVSMGVSDAVSGHLRKRGRKRFQLPKRKPANEGVSDAA
jgi:1-acyl-sn-glycerol-3-phosphate acyltransferase